MPEPSPSDEAIRARVREVIAEYFGYPVDKIRNETVAGDVEGWDSTRHVGLILALEDEFGFEFDIDRISAFENIGELIEECVRMTHQS